RAQLRCCLERLKQQVPAGPARPSTLNLLHRARLHIQLSEPSEGEDVEIEVDSVVFGGDLLPGFGTGRDHSYSSPRSPTS
ncbi:hypothetical protein A306_00000319, partial [Columba livia]